LVERRFEKFALRVAAAAVVNVNQTVINDQTKSPAGMRTLPICTPLFDALSAIPPEQRNGLVCVSAGEKQLSQSGFRRGWDGFNLAMQRILNGEDPKQQGRRESLDKKIEAGESCWA
jgi:hypothetical protein